MFDSHFTEKASFFFKLIVSDPLTTFHAFVSISIKRQQQQRYIIQRSFTLKRYLKCKNEQHIKMSSRLKLKPSDEMTEAIGQDI